MPNLNSVQWSETFVGRFHDLHDISTSCYQNGEKTSTVDREYSKTKKKSSEIDNKTHT